MNYGHNGRLFEQSILGFRFLDIYFCPKEKKRETYNK